MRTEDIVWPRVFSPDEAVQDCQNEITTIINDLYGFYRERCEENARLQARLALLEVKAAATEVEQIVSDLSIVGAEGSADTQKAIADAVVRGLAQVPKINRLYRQRFA